MAECGEWSSGQKWASDAPLDHVYPETVNLINNGSCGAFIHGLEDEFDGKFIFSWNYVLIVNRS